MKGGETSEWSEAGEFALLTLQDDGTDNSYLITKNAGRQAHVSLASRTLYKDDKWNTICLPFDVVLEDSPLAGATAKTLTDADDGIYYMTDESKLKHTGKPRTLKACRAYFQFSEAAAARNFVLDFGNGETTGITTTDFTDYTDKAGAWYTVDGKKLDKQPMRKGLYIQNGQKVVIK